MKKLITIGTIALLGLGLIAGVGTVLAHQVGDNSGPGSLNSDRILEIEEEEEVSLIDNSGPGSLNSGRVEEEELAEAEAIVAPELEIKEAGEIEIKGAEVTYVSTDSFGVMVQGLRLHVTVLAGTEFNDDLMLSDLMAGDIVKVEGTISSTDHHVVLAEEIEIEE